jgi:hypothetical protein
LPHSFVQQRQIFSRSSAECQDLLFQIFAFDHCESSSPSKMVSVRILLLIFTALQISRPATSVQGDRFQIAVPQGWKVLVAGSDVVLEHSSGASLLLLRATPTSNLPDFAERQAERIMSPLELGKLGEPKHFKSTNEEWVQYEIRGDRLDEHRRILYRAFRHGGALFELVYENTEDGFDQLLTEAQEIVSSLQTRMQTAAPKRRSRARR